MDLIIYCAVLFMLGMMRVSKTKDVDDSIGIVETGETSTVNCELPVASNLQLIRDRDAFTIILKEFDL